MGGEEKEHDLEDLSDELAKWEDDEFNLWVFDGDSEWKTKSGDEVWLHDFVLNKYGVDIWEQSEAENLETKNGLVQQWQFEVLLPFYTWVFDGVWWMKDADNDEKLYGYAANKFNLTMPDPLDQEAMKKMEWEAYKLYKNATNTTHVDLYDMLTEAEAEEFNNWTFNGEGWKKWSEDELYQYLEDQYGWKEF